MASSGSAVAKHLTRNAKIEGSNPNAREGEKW
jgi:hypothetical protein